jgi:outer membrane protein assembly factor BamD
MADIKKFKYFCATFKNMNLRVFIVLIISLIITSCSEYEKLLKSPDFELKKNKVKEYYDKKQYSKATGLLAQVLPRYRATEEAEELNWMNAQSYYGIRDYMMAGTEFKNFSDLYPYSKRSDEATYLTALCYYYQSPRAELDQQNTRDGIDGFYLYVTRFPASPKVADANKYIKELQERLVQKSYLSAKLYYDRKEYKAAVVALNNSLKEYPETSYREEMMYLKLSSLYLYAGLSVESRQKERYQAALDDYYSYMEEFPKGNYSKEVTRIFQSTGKILKIDTDNKATNQ